MALPVKRRGWMLAGTLLAGACARDCAPAPPLQPTGPAKPSLQGLPPTACVAPPRPSASIKLTPVFAGLELEAPVALIAVPAEPGATEGRWLALGQRGLVHSFRAGPSGELLAHQAIDLRDRVFTPQHWLGELGLLGLALHPRYPHDPRLFLSYTRKRDGIVSQTSSFVFKDGRFDPATEQRLLDVRQPFDNHNGGQIVFGPDGYLYIGFGDGGQGGDPLGHGQNTQTLLGAVLRIDVDQPSPGKPYGIPADNPFVRGGGRAEIFAYGLRNPWGFSFDRDTGELWAADVGQETWEEVNILRKGGNYGWNVREGLECYPIGKRDCSSDGLQAPLYVYKHPVGQVTASITGGFRYRGARLPELVGGYVFGDYISGEIWVLKHASGGQVQRELLVRSGLNLSAFAEDQSGELYALDYAGRVLRIDPDHGQVTLPSRLSQTGCVDPAHPERVASGVLPYDVAFPFWSDGVSKERFIALPPGAKLKVGADGDLEVPPGSVLIKHFKDAERLIETRFYVRHADGEYSGYGYAWRPDGSDAELVTVTRSERVGERDWLYPGLEACNQCHTAAAGRTLGLELRQLATPAGGASSRQVSTQAEHGSELQSGDLLQRLQRAGALESAASPADSAGAVAVSSSAVSAVALPAAGDATVPLADRARAYLHVNCSSCHRPSGPGRGGLDLRLDVPLAQTGLCGRTTLDALGTSGSLLVPGNPAESIAWLRLSRRDKYAMPPLGSLRADEAGAELIREWIASLTQCD